MSVDREGAQRLTTTGRNMSPVWSADGRFIYFASDREGSTDIWRRPADLSAPAERVLESPGAELPTSASQDGRWLYYSLMAPGNSDIGRVSLGGDPVVEVLVDSRADELSARVSRDGRFICFQSDEAGRWDIHVIEIDGGRRWIVSSVEGFAPLWSRDGGSIFYMGDVGTSYRVDVQTSPDFAAADPVLAFEIDSSRQGQIMDLGPDGKRMLVGFSDAGDGETGGETRPRVTVVLNWLDRIEERLGGEVGSR
jgi:Tol biopolymer transport system component